MKATKEQKRKRRITTLVIVGVIWMVAILAPEQFGSSLGWLAGTAVVYWPVTLGLVALVVYAKRNHKKNQRRSDTAATAE